MYEEFSCFVGENRLHLPYADVLVLHGLNVKANGGNSCHNLTKFELVKNGGLTSGIETNHKNTHLRLAEQTFDDAADLETHLA